MQCEMRGTISREVEIPLDSIAMTGELSLPAEAAGLVVFAQGSGNRNVSNNRRVAEIINEAGFGTLLLDLLTQREEAIDLRTRHLRFDLPLLARRLAVATAWIRRQPEFCGLRIGYMGSNTGGGAALMAAAKLGDQIGAVASRGSRPDMAGAALEQVLAPTLLIVGGLDDEIIHLNESALARMHCVRELSIVPCASHLFEEPGALDAVAHLAATWFRRYLLA